ncbi:4-hydroxy-tetrahydrodipicolinate synthase [Acetivibrio cellulolyticus]|uniref:4-hydroxy-tetrahydrodipicolinate synthase n=1 Tax=Acetivibrio cellulolyticus TaxID=35830 RepID=UPI0001E2F56E|nr:4-hydroxy-tetrahydrodipicolinate synthase [Acetivibrio cellulolyticus]
MKLEGVYVAVVTPFENGKIAEKTYEEYLEKLIQSGIAGIVVCGSTGESSMITMEEHTSLFRLSKEIVNNRIQVIANAGANSTDEAVYLTKEAEKTGVDAVLSVVPYYVKPTQEGIFLHYKAIHDETDNIPLIIYNVPGRTAVDIKVETVVRLSSLERYIGIKESSSDMEKVSNLVAQTKPNFSVLSGNDGTFLPLLAVGGHGIISVIGNIMPKELVALYNSVKKGDLNTAIEINTKMLPLFQALSFEANPIPVKYALYKMGQVSSELKLPLTMLSETYQKKMDQVLKDLSLI